MPDQPPPDPVVEVTARRGTVSGGLWNAAATVLPMGSTLALSIVISRELGAAVLGEQSVIAYVASLLVSVLIFSFTSASIQLLATAVGAKDDDRLAWLARWSGSAHLTGGLLAAGLMAGIGVFRDEYRLLWFLAAATALVDAVGWSRTVRDIAHRGWTRTSRRRLVAQAVGPLASIAAIYLGWGIEGVFAAQLVVAVGLLITLAHLDRSLPRLPRRPAGRPDWRPVVTTWLAFSGSMLISQIIQRRIELVFLDQFHDGPTVAMFSVAANVITIPVVLTSTLIGASLPAIAARWVQDPETVTAVMGRTARVVCTLGVLLSAATFAVGPGLVRTAYGAEFTQAAEIVRYLALMLLVVPLGQVCTTLWTGIGRLRPVLWCGGIAAVTDVVLALVLIPPFSLAGAVITTFVAQTVGAVLILGYTLRQGVALHLAPWRLAAAVGVAAAAAAAAVLVRAEVDGLLGDVCAGAVFLVVAAVGVRLARVFAADDLHWLAEALPGPAGRAVRVLAP
ncbi:Membrane protein involved in the export of O-antigen and teichoic acid [Klenkia marina]|uniref:Membrane protein involved in the export of O-antigen and teichoic acid n=1 Tax=Klenkia marina TaxID=1960309 RepID=A0A1G4XFT5_9ACTN|nr:polysaccharide biosynthesis C-terminal domain-containing protein [Klenkia marina]SCX40069.1 Membrane protein involved in the export of O-antigen and teichoic acid [Klenkia marina]